MNCLVIAALVVGAAAPVPPPQGGVLVPEGGFRGRSQLVIGQQIQDVGSPTDRFAGFLGSQLPASDRGKWWIVLYTDVLRDPESTQLVRDFETHRALKKLDGWAKRWTIDKNISPAAEARIAAAMAQDHQGKLPAILVVPNPEDPTFGKPSGDWHYAYKGSGYGGDADLLARNLYEAIRNEYLRRNVSQCPGPYCPDTPKPQPNPYQPPGPPPFQPNPPSPQPNPSWPQQPSPPRMDDPQDQSAGGEKVPWLWIVLLGAGFLAYIVARNQGWLNPPGGPTAGLLLLLILALAASGPGCRWRRPWRRPSRVPVLQLATPGAALAAVAPAGQAAPVPYWQPDDTGGLAVLSRLQAMVDGLIYAAKLVIGGLAGVGLLNLVVGWRTLRTLRELDGRLRVTRFGSASIEYDDHRAGTGRTTGRRADG